MRNPARRKTPGHERQGHRSKTAAPPPEPAARAGFDWNLWREYWQKVGLAEERIKAARMAFREQPHSRERQQQFRVAVAEKFALLREMFTYQRGSPPENQDDLNWWHVQQAYELLRGGDVSLLSDVIRFLEEDPWFHGSGYLKEKLSHAIKAWMLHNTEAERLRAVCLTMVDKRDGREFRGFCRLAQKTDAPQLRDELSRRLASTDPAVGRRAKWMLEALQAQEKSNDKSA